MFFSFTNDNNKSILSRKDNPLLPDRLAAFESVFKQISAK